MQLKVEMQEVLLAKEDQEEVLRRRERELTALKGALKEEVAAHDQEVDKMKEQYEKEISKLQTSLAEAKQVISPPFVFPPLSSSLTPCVHLLLISFALDLPRSRDTLSQRSVEISIRGAVSVCVLCITSYAMCLSLEVGLLL